LEIGEIAASLSEIEKGVLRALYSLNEGSEIEIAGKSGMNIDSVRRAAAWLAEKGLADAKERHSEKVSLTKEGENAKEFGLAEKRLILALKGLNGKGTLEELGKKAGLEGKEVNVALGIAKKNAWVSLGRENGLTLELTGLESDVVSGKYPLELALEEIARGKGKADDEKIKALIARGLAEREAVVEREFGISANGREALKLLEDGKSSGRAYDIRGAVPTMFIGKRQPYIQFLSLIRRRLTELGFREMESKLIELEFYNFDVLFQPQNHPARAWTDTYHLLRPTKGKLPSKEIVGKVKSAHENGGRTGSKGWGYKWESEIASRLMPAAHGTAASARQLIKGVEVPGKYFCLARCYRPDIIDATHLNEFNQMEGFIVDKDFSFRHLLGMLKNFAVEIGGAKKVKFYPDYYPFTEPSVQVSAEHPELGWIELGGAGIFRPEITEQLGIEGRALAWGLGIDRLAMCALGINDMRYLFSQDISWLRKEKAVWK